MTGVMEWIGCLTTPQLIKQIGYCHGRKEMYLMTHSTHFIYGYSGIRHMVKDHSDSERGNPLLPHGLLFPISSKGSFIYIIPQDNT